MNNLNCSKWKVSSNPINGTTLYAVYQIRDINSVDHSGNRNYASEWMADKQMAIEIAEKLNLEEE